MIGKRLLYSSSLTARRLFSTKIPPLRLDAEQLLEALAVLDTASLCDADKAQLVKANPAPYDGLRLLEGLQARNAAGDGRCMVGIARTVQCTDPNDFLAVLQGLAQADQDEVLVVSTKNSSRAVAGELFCAEAARRGVRGVVVDGPMRDTAYLDEFPDVRCFSASVTPYAGTADSVGEMQVTVDCGGVHVSPGDVLVGDKDGIVVGSQATFTLILETAKRIQKTERKIKERVWRGTSIHSLTNYKEHIKARTEGRESALEFQVS